METHKNIHARSNELSKFSPALSRVTKYIAVWLLSTFLNTWVSSAQQNSVSTKKSPLWIVDAKNTYNLDTLTQVRSDLVVQLNQIRTSHSKSQLETDEYLNKKAQDYAVYMANNKDFYKNKTGKFTDHIDKNGHNWSQRVNQNGKLYSPLWENLAKWQLDVKEVLDDWMWSTPHRDNILETQINKKWLSYTKVWIWFYKWYWVLLLWG